MQNSQSVYSTTGVTAIAPEARQGAGVPAATIGGKWRHWLTMALNLATIAWFFYVLEGVSDAGMSWSQRVISILGSWPLVGLWLINLCVNVWAFRRRGRSYERPSFVWLCLPLVLVMLSLLMQQHGRELFKLRLALSARALQATGSETWREPRVVGLFVVYEKIASGTELRFTTAECGILDTCGLVYSPEGPPQRIGADGFTPLGNSWWHWRNG